ncbi:MAG: hypothetical protein ACREV5_08865 [Steroidobacter sp.]
MPALLRTADRVLRNVAAITSSGTPAAANSRNCRSDSDDQALGAKDRALLRRRVENEIERI